jgi:hypothetical protein
MLRDACDVRASQLRFRRSSLSASSWSMQGLDEVSMNSVRETLVLRVRARLSLMGLDG